MTVKQVIGARYVPLFSEPIDWDNTKTYEPLTIVYYGGNSYTSKQAVPKGIDITNTDYWALTGNYNAQIEQYRKEVQAYDSRITANTNTNATQDAQLAGTSDSGLKTLIEENAVYKPYNEESTDVGNSENRKFYTHDSLVHTNKTYGNYNNAVTSYFGANVNNNLAPVLGTNTQGIFSYENIDSVCLVAENDGLNIQWLANPNTYTINNKTISFNDATIKPGIGSYIALIDSNSFNIKVSDIKILAKIIAINDNVYTVDGWFNSSGTTTPSTSYYVLVNPLTKIWATNFNFSNPNNKTLSGTGCEVGIFNENSNFNEDIGGVDVYNARESAEYAFRAHSRLNTIDKGLDTTNCNKVINAYGTPGTFTELIHSTRTDKPIPYIKSYDGSDSYRGLIKYEDPDNDNWLSFIKLSTATSYDLSDLHDGQELYIAAGANTIQLNCGRLETICYTYNNETKVASSNMKFDRPSWGYMIFHIFGMESRAYIESVTNGTFKSVDS